MMCINGNITRHELLLSKNHNNFLAKMKKKKEGISPKVLNREYFALLRWVCVITKAFRVQMKLCTHKIRQNQLVRYMVRCSVIVFCCDAEKLNSEGVWRILFNIFLAF